MIELMVSLAVLAILLGIAVPSFRQMLSSNRITGRSNDLIGDLRLARSEAVRRAQPVTMLAGDPDDYLKRGWIVMPDADGNGAAATPATATDGIALRVFDVAAGSITLRRVSVSGTGYADVTTAADRGYIVFTAQGLLKADVAILLRVCDSARTSAEGRVIAVNAAGKISLENAHASCL